MNDRLLDMRRRCECVKGAPINTNRAERQEQRSGNLVTVVFATPKSTGVVTGGVTGEVERLVLVLEGAMSRVKIQQALGLRHEDHFRAKYLIPALQSGLVEMTSPDRPKSSRQQYRLTAKAEALRAKLSEEKRL